MNTLALPLDLHALEKLRAEELEEARSIQAEMLPAESLHAGPVTISHEFKPIAAVGGDFLDYFQLTDGTFGLYLCDVSGKGLPAALYAALSVGTLRGVHKTGTSPSEALATFNRRLLMRGMRGHSRPFSPLRRWLPPSGALGDSPGIVPGHALRNSDRAAEPGRFRAFLYRPDHRRVRPGRGTIWSRAFAGTLQQQAPSFAGRTIAQHLFRG